MATALEGCSTEEQRSFVRFFGQRYLMNNIHKDMCPVDGGTHLSRKEVQNWIVKLSQGRSEVADNETEVRKWLRQQSKDFCVAGFDAMRQVCQC
jgi:hypothetical protein